MHRVYGMRTVKKLDAANHEKTRTLYEEAFYEDSREFVDYYYQYKALENEIYAVVEAGGENAFKILSMLHLNPYKLTIFGEERDCHYIVAVATDRQYRHQGLMSSLIKESLQDMYRRREPFTFLMPAAEAIYTPFGFRMFGIQNKAVWEPSRQHIPGADQPAGQPGMDESSRQPACQRTECRVRKAGVEDAGRLAGFVQRYLVSGYDIFASRDERYYRRLIKELECEEGSIVLVEREGKITGSFLAAGDVQAGQEKDEAEVREIIASPECLHEMPGVIRSWEPGYSRIKLSAFQEELALWFQKEGGWQAEESPLMMGRIVHLETMIESMRSEKEETFYIEVTDHILPGNSGAFYCRFGREGGECCRVSAKEAQDNGAEKLDIAELGERLLNRGKVFLNEMV